MAEPNDTLPCAPDSGDYHSHEPATEDGEIRVLLNAPDSLSHLSVPVPT